MGEALSAGKLCVCSNRTSIPEVGGDFCDYLDPYDYLSAFETIERTIFDKEALAAKTRRVAADFVPRTWSGFAQTMVERIRTTGEVSQPLVPLIEDRKLVRFTWDALVTDQTTLLDQKDRQVRPRLRLVGARILGRVGRLREAGVAVPGPTHPIRWSP